MKKTVFIILLAVPAVLLVAVILVSVYGVSSGAAYRPGKDVVKRLEGTKLMTENGKTFFGNAWMENRGGMSLLHLEGTPYETGYQHGRLLRDEVMEGAPKFYADVIFGGREKPFSPKIWFLRKYLEYKVYVPLEKSQPRNILEELKGIADGSGVPFEVIFRANHHTGPAMMLTPDFARDNLEALEKLGVTTGACSTFAAAGKVTAGGKIIVGRNTDYSGFTRWPKHQALFFVKPKDGYAHVKIGTAGILLWNPGMNEKGIVTCPHYMVYDDVSPKGWCVATFTDEILRKAETLKEAEEIFHDNPRGISGGFVVISGKERNAFAAEISAGSAAIRPMEDGKIVMTNMAVSDEKRKIDITVKYNIMEHLPGRYRRLMKLMDQNRGWVNPALAAEFMGDHIQHTTGLERATGHIVGVSDNVNSMVFSPEDLTLWVAHGPAPVCNNNYLGLSLAGELRGERTTASPPVLRGYVFRNHMKLRSLAKFMEAYGINERDPDNKEGIIQALKGALAIDQEESHYSRLLAKLLIHRGEYDGARAVMEQALKSRQSFRERAHSFLIMGMVSDLTGRRDDALSWYGRVRELADSQPEDPWFAMNRFVLAFADKYAKYPFTVGNLSDQAASPDFIDPYME